MSIIIDCFSYYKLIHRHIQEKEAPHVCGLPFHLALYLADSVLMCFYGLSCKGIVQILVLLIPEGFVCRFFRIVQYDIVCSLLSSLVIIKIAMDIPVVIEVGDDLMQVADGIQYNIVTVSIDTYTIVLQLLEHGIGEKIEESLKDTTTLGMSGWIHQDCRVCLDTDTPFAILVPCLHTILCIVESDGIVALAAYIIVDLLTVSLGDLNINASACNVVKQVDMAEYRDGTDCRTVLLVLQFFSWLPATIGLRDS